MTSDSVQATDWAGEFRAPQSMTPPNLADSIARLVWESFSDFLMEAEAGGPLKDLGITGTDGTRDEEATEETLIFLMWAHTRGVQKAFLGRADSTLVHEGLDAIHTAIFEDLEANGTPQNQLPIFEQRVSARYAEYNAAAGSSDHDLGRAVTKRVSGHEEASEAAVHAVIARAIAVSRPLKDFLEDVDLVSAA